MSDEEGEGGVIDNRARVSKIVVDRSPEVESIRAEKEELEKELSEKKVLSHNKPCKNLRF
jgi:hypothetical protein